MVYFFPKFAPYKKYKMQALHIVEALLAAYLLGSIPTSIWVGKVFFGIDIREHGSGNAGATNTFRVMGAKAGIPVFVIDVVKGWFALYLARYSGIAEGSELYVIFQLFLGLCAFLGHVFPVFAGFRGGKGVATLAGVSVGLHPLATLCAFAIFAAVFLLTGYVSVGSMSAGVAFPLFVVFLFKEQTLALVAFACVIAVFILFTHRKNIRRLRAGTESRFFYGKKQQS